MKHMKNMRDIMDERYVDSLGITKLISAAPSCLKLIGEICCS